MIIYVRYGHIARISVVHQSDARACNCETAFLPLLSRSARSYLAAWILYHRGKIRSLKRLFDERGTAARISRRHVLPSLQAHAADTPIVWLHVVLLVFVCGQKYNINV